MCWQPCYGILQFCFNVQRRLSRVGGSCGGTGRWVTTGAATSLFFALRSVFVDATHQKIACLENCSLLISGNSLDLLMIRADQPTPGTALEWNRSLMPRQFLTPCFSRSGFVALVSVGRLVIDVLWGQYRGGDQRRFGPCVSGGQYRVKLLLVIQ